VNLVDPRAGTKAINRSRAVLVGPTASSLLRTIFAAAAIGFVAVVTTAALMWSFVQLDHGEVRTAIRQAFADGALVVKSGQLFDLRRGDYLFNDCLLLQTMLLGRDDWRHSVIDATIYLNDEPCRTLEEEVTNQRPSASTYQYSRYIFAARVASAPLIALFGVEHTKRGLEAVTYSVLLLTAAIAIYALATGGGSHTRPRSLYIAGLLCVAAMLGAYRLEYYAQTLSHGYSELVIAAFLLYAVALSSEKKDRGVPIAAIVLGVLTGCFELLTGPSLVAVGVAVLLDHCAAPARSRPYQRAALVGFGCAAGILLAVFWQQSLISALSDAQPFYQFATHLAMRLQLHQFFAIPFEPQWATTANLQLYSFGDVVGAVVDALPTLTYGSSRAAQLVFICSALIVVAGTALSRRETRPGCVIAAVVGLSVPVWYLAFANHTYLHSVYMVRMAVLLPVCAGISLMFILAPNSWMAASNKSAAW